MESADEVRVTPAPAKPSTFRPRPVNQRVPYQNNTRRATLMRAEAGDIHLELVPDLREVQEFENRDGEKVSIEAEDPEFHDVVLWLKKGQNGRAYPFHLTLMTEYELLCFRDAVAAAVEMVLPTARELDERARNRDSSDGRTNRRLYRGVPAIHTNQAPPRVYVEGLYDESAGTPVLEWPPGLTARRAGTRDDELAERGGDEGEEPGDGQAVEG